MLVYRMIFVFFGFITAFVLADFLQSAFAQTAHKDQEQWQLIAPNRQRLSLNGTWSLSGERDKSPKKATVPGILEKGDEKRLTRNFILPDSLKNKAIILHVLGINYQCRISVNGSPIASHAGGYTAFDFELKPEVLRFEAENTLTIEINGELTPKTTLPFKHRPFGWKHQAGILREIYLEAKPSVAIGDVRVRQQFYNAYQDVSLAVDLDVQTFSEVEDTLLNARNFEIYCEAFEENLTTPFATSEKRVFELDESAKTIHHLEIDLKNVKKWAVQQPNLYTLAVYLVANKRLIDAVHLSLGLRELTIKNKTFMLNGAPIFVKGVTWVDELSGLAAGQIEKKIDTLMGRLKSLGVNTLRVVGYPPHSRLTERCSREGILLLEEIPLNCVNHVQLQSEQVAKVALQQLDEMIRRDRLQPSVLGWGLGANLDESQGAAEKLLARLTAKARSLDDRLVYSINRRQSKGPFAEAVDFVLSDHFGFTAFSLDSNSTVNKPVLPIIGFWAENGAFSGSELDYGRKRGEAEARQAENLQRMLETYKSNWPDSAGYFVHALSDWRGDLPLLAPGSDRDAFVYPAGLIDLNGKFRIGFRMFAAYNLHEQKPPISPNESASRQPVVFPLTGISAILVFLFFLNRDKKFRVQLRRAFVHPHGLYSDIFENRKTPVFLTFLLGVLQGVVFALLVTSVFYHFRENLIFDEILNLLVPSSKTKVYLIWLIWRPAWMLGVVASAYFVLMVSFAFFLRIFAFFFKSTLTFFQYFTLVFWTAVSYLPLALIAPIFYRLLPEKEIALYSVSVFAVFILWHFIRLQRGLRVFYVISPIKSMLLCLILAGILVGSVLFYYDRTQAIFDYYAYYSAMVRR